MHRLIDELALAPHPEGGFYRQVYKSAQRVRERERDRSAMTAIYFLLPRGHISRWHRVESDEVWVFLEGDGLRLHTWDGGEAREHELGAAGMHVVPAGVWQAAEPIGDYALVACFVGPGFEFDDFRMMRDEPAAAEQLPAGSRRFL